MVDARLADGSRVNIVLPPLVLNGGTISIRKFAKQNITLDIDGAAGQSVGAEWRGFCSIAAQLRANILISGGTGSGKTTLLNAVSRYIDRGERIITIEDAVELRLQQPHVVQMETRAAEHRRRRRRSRSASLSATRCACAPTASSSARCAAPKPSTCCRR